jgi:hypothetical protein
MYHNENNLQEKFKTNLNEGNKTSANRQLKPSRLNDPNNSFNADNKGSENLPVYTPEELQEIFEEHFPPYMLASINVVFDYTRRFPMATPSHRTIAKLAKCSVRTVAKAIALAKELGIIRVKHRFNLSNVYFVPKYIFGEEYVEKLARYLPGLRSALCLALLLSGLGLNKSVKATEFKLPSEKLVMEKRHENNTNSNVEKYKNSFFGSPKSAPVDKCNLIFNNKEDNLLSPNVGKLLRCENGVGLQQRKTLLGDGSPNRANAGHKILDSKRDYWFLSDHGRYLVHQMAMTPAQAVRLVYYPEEVLRECFEAYVYAACRNKSPIRNRVKYIQGILNNAREKHGIKIEPFITGMLISGYSVDSSITKLTYAQAVHLQQQTAYIGENYRESLKRERAQAREVRKSDVSDEALRLEKERIQRLRSNPYSVYYTGPRVDTQSKVCKVLTDSQALSSMPCKKRTPQPPAESISLAEYTKRIRQFVTFLELVPLSEQEKKDALAKKKHEEASKLSHEDRKHAEL